LTSDQFRISTRAPPSLQANKHPRRNMTQFTLYSHKGGPNGWKVAFVLEELGLTYETIYLDFAKQEQKGPEFTKLNPNGRIPALVDHKHKDFTIWESNAIIEYLAAKYDPKHLLSFPDFENTQYVRQWLYFQASGQGPYFGQATWFLNNAPDNKQAVERYQNETKRVLTVLDGVLAKQEWLVGGRISVADIAFLTWNNTADARILGSAWITENTPHVRRWISAITARPAIKKVLDVKASV